MASIRIICDNPYMQHNKAEVELFADSPLQIIGEYVRFNVDGKMKIIPINRIIRIEACD